MDTVKIATTKSEKTKYVQYQECLVIAKLTAHDRQFVVHKSYNKLLRCYMLSEYTTGFTLKAYGVPLTDMKDGDVDGVVNRAKEYLESHSKDSIKAMVGKLPVVNDGFMDIADEINYSDVEVAQRLAKEMKKELDQVVEHKTQKTSVAKKKPATKPRATKRKPKSAMNTLI